MTRHYVAIKNESVPIHTHTKSDNILAVKKQGTKQYKDVVSFLRIIYLLISVSQDYFFPQNFLECLLKYTSNIHQSYWTVVSKERSQRNVLFQVPGDSWYEMSWENPDLS